MTSRTKAKKQKALSVSNNERLDYVKIYAPSLVEKRASLLPFDDVIFSESAGPQPETMHYDPSEEPYFSIEVHDPQYSGNHYSFRVTDKCVEMEHWGIDSDGEHILWDDVVVIDMEELWNFLRQLPRPPHGFISTYR